MSGKSGAPPSQIPGPLKQFLANFFDNLVSADVKGLEELYERWHVILDDYKGRSLPEPIEAAAFYRESGRLHEMVIYLYEILYYKHLFSLANYNITWLDRYNSSQAFGHLFYLVVNHHIAARGKQGSDEAVRLYLPHYWWYDIVDSYTEQYLEAAEAHRMRLATDGQSGQNSLLTAPYSDQPVEMDSIWRAEEVFLVLHSIVDLSSIQERLYSKTPEVGPDGIYHVRYTLGYFALISLLKLYTRHGDFYRGLRMIELIDLEMADLQFRVAVCVFVLYYHIGICHIMNGEYKRAVKYFSYFLSFWSHYKDKLEVQKSYLHECEQLVEKMAFLNWALCHMMNIPPPEGPVTFAETQFAALSESVMHNDIESWKDVFFACFPLFVSNVRGDHKLDPSVFPELNTARDALGAKEGETGTRARRAEIIRPIVELRQSEAITRHLISFFEGITFQYRIAKQDDLSLIYSSINLAKLSPLTNSQQEGREVAWAFTERDNEENEDNSQNVEGDEESNSPEMEKKYDAGRAIIMSSLVATSPHRFTMDPACFHKFNADATEVANVPLHPPVFITSDSVGLVVPCYVLYLTNHNASPSHIMLDYLLVDLKKQNPHLLPQLLDDLAAAKRLLHATTSIPPPRGTSLASRA